MIFLARHLFYLRTLTFLVCGAVRMNFRKFLFADALAALISAPLMMIIGFMGAKNYDAIMNGVARIKHITLFVIIILMVAGIYYYLKKKSLVEDTTDES